MTLAKLKRNQKARIAAFEVSLSPLEKRRLQDLGFFEGAEIACVRQLPFEGPRVYRVGGAVFSIEESLARKVILGSERSQDIGVSVP
jgi:Fe2+ transport system protein FeoA